MLFIGGVDNDIHAFSLATHSIAYTLRGHSDTITSLAVSPNGQQLLSASIDSTVHLWNVQPFAPTLNATNPALHPRLVRSFYGAPAGFEGLLRKASWSRHQSSDGSTGSMVCVGGSDRALTVWDSKTAEILYKVRLCSQPANDEMLIVQPTAARSQRYCRCNRLVTEGTHQ